MIVFNRNLKKDDFDTIDKYELIYYKDNNIAYIITKKDNLYVVHKYKIFNRQLIDTYQFKTSLQVIKSC